MNEKNKKKTTMVTLLWSIFARDRERNLGGFHYRLFTKISMAQKKASKALSNPTS